MVIYFSKNAVSWPRECFPTLESVVRLHLDYGIHIWASLGRGHESGKSAGKYERTWFGEPLSGGEREEELWLSLITRLGVYR